MERVGKEKKSNKTLDARTHTEMNANCIADPGEPNPNPAVQKAEPHPTDIQTPAQGTTPGSGSEAEKGPG